MLQRAFFSTFAVTLCSALLVQPALAIPSKATLSKATVTGVYNPLNLDLTLSDGTNALTYANYRCPCKSLGKTGHHWCK